MTWHHEDCEGQCLACLIQDIVKQTYGNQGLAYLLRNVEQHKIIEKQHAERLSSARLSRIWRCDKIAHQCVEKVLGTSRLSELDAAIKGEG